MTDVILAGLGEVPKNAQVITRTEAFFRKYQSIDDHKPVSDVLAVKYGPILSGILGCASGYVMLSHFRKALGITAEAKFSAHLFVVGLPFFTSSVFHYLFTTQPVVLEERICSLCLEAQSAAIQFVTGVVFPVSSAFLSNNLTAMHLGMNVPLFSRPLSLLKFGKQMILNDRGNVKLASVLILNVFGAMLLVQAESYTLVQFNRRLAVREIMRSIDE